MTNRHILAVSFAIFIGIGVLTAALGPSLDDLAEQTGSDLAALGAIFTASFGGTMIAQISSGPLYDRVGQRPLMLAGALVGALGTLGIVLSHALWLTLTSSVFFGIGFGALDVSTNILIAQAFATRSVPVLNLLHTFFGVGSVIGPAIASGSPAVGYRAAVAVGRSIVLIPVPAIRMTAGPAQSRKMTPCREIQLPGPCCGRWAQCSWCMSASRPGWARGSRPMPSARPHFRRRRRRCSRRHTGSR
jgi:MFS family permease